MHIQNRIPKVTYVRYTIAGSSGAIAARSLKRALCTVGGNRVRHHGSKSGQLNVVSLEKRSASSTELWWPLTACRAVQPFDLLSRLTAPNVASLVGALVLARAVNDPKLSGDILRATKNRLDT
jgi:hypothetical protein